MPTEVDLPEPELRRRFWEEVLIPGSLAGLFAATITGLFSIASAAVVGKDPWLPLKLLSGTIFRGYSLLQLHGGAAFWGAVLLYGAAGALGVLFALLLPRHGTAMAGLFIASAYGLVLYLGLVELGLWSDPLLEHTIGGRGLFPYTLLFGICLAVVVPLRSLAEKIPLSVKLPDER